MSTTEIPDEIMREAQLVREGSTNDPEWYLAETFTKHIARALMARDQRAADIAKNAADHHLRASSLNLPIEPSPIIAKDRANVAARIASAILTYSEGADA